MASRSATLLVPLLFLLYGPRAGRAQAACDNATALSMQLDALLALLDREAPPGNRVLVSLALDIRHATVHEKDSSLRILADLKMSWIDKRLSWNASEWGCDSGLVPAERLWLPDVVLLSGAAGAGGGGGGGEAALRARLASDGAAVWLTRLDLTAPVALALRDWPADTQTSSFKFGSRMYTSDELELTINDYKHAVVFESGAWEVVSVTGSTEEWSRGAVRSSVAAWAVRVRRRAPAHSLAAGAVLLAALLLLAAAAALPPAERAPLAAAAATIAAMWLTSALTWLPGAATVPRVLRLECAACACAGALCAAAAAAHWLAARRSPPPRCLRALLARASLLCDLTPHPEAGAGAGAEGGAGAGAWGGAARLLDACARAALAVTIITLAGLYFF